MNGRPTELTDYYITHYTTCEGGRLIPMEDWAPGTAIHTMFYKHRVTDEVIQVDLHQQSVAAAQRSTYAMVTEYATRSEYESLTKAEKRMYDALVRGKWYKWGAPEFKAMKSLESKGMVRPAARVKIVEIAWVPTSGFVPMSYESWYDPNVTRRHKLSNDMQSKVDPAK